MNTRFIPPYGASAPEWMRLASSNFNALAGDLSGLFSSSPNYVGDGSNATFVVSQGSTTTPSTSQDAVMVVSKTANVSAFNGFAAFAFKQSSATSARATAIYAEASDNVGGTLSFVEGTRSQATLIAGTGGSAYGGVFAAGTNSAGVITPAFLIAVEAETDNQIGPDAPTFSTFNPNAYTAAYVATNGVGGGTRYKADAGFVTNPFSLKPFRTGLLFAAGSIDDTGIAYRSGVNIQVGIDMSQATISGAAFKSPGFSISGSGVIAMTPITVASLPAAGTAGRRAFVSDATALTFASTVAGGGSNKVPVWDNGTNWVIG